MPNVKLKQVKTKDELYTIQNHIPGETVYCEDDKTIYIWDEEKGWQALNTSADGNGLNLNLYDLNKNIISQLNTLTYSELFDKMSIIAEYYDNSNNDFHMLLCRDYNYYTLFNKKQNAEHGFAKTIHDIITDIGGVYSIEPTSEGAIEIWIRPIEEETPLAFYLFPYDAGVVDYNG